MSEDEKEEMEEFTYSSEPTQLAPESQIQNEESLRENCWYRLQILWHSHMKANEISNVETRIHQARVINPIHPSHNDCNNDVSRAVDGQQQLQQAVSEAFAVAANSIEDVIRMSNPNSPYHSDNSAPPSPNPTSDDGSALPNLSEAQFDSQNHQSPSWFDKMDQAKQTRLRVTVLKHLEGTLTRDLETELFLSFGLPKNKTAQILTYVQATGGNSSSGNIKPAQQAACQDDESWATLAPTRKSRRRRRGRKAQSEDGQSTTTSVTTSRQGSPQRSEVSMAEVLSVASTKDTGFASVTGLKAVRAQQLREKTAARQMEQILLDVTEDNLDSSADKLFALMSNSPDLLNKGARLLVHSQKPSLKKTTMAESKQRAENRGAVLATLIAIIMPKFGSGEEFKSIVLDECLTECHKVSPPPKFSISSLIGELQYPHDIVDDDFIHQCIEIMLQPERRSHVQAIAMMLGRCTPDWKHKQRLVFPHGHYDELKRQARTMGKPTYMAVKSLAERTRPSWMDRKEEAYQRRNTSRKAKQIQQQGNNPNWQHRRQPDQNWAKNAADNKSSFTAEKTPSETSSRGRSRRNRRNRRANRTPSPQIREISPARSDVTLPAYEPLPNMRSSKSLDVSPQSEPQSEPNFESVDFENHPGLAMMDLDRPSKARKSYGSSAPRRGSAHSLIEALNRAPSIRDIQKQEEEPVFRPEFSPAPMPCGAGKPQIEDDVSIAQTDATDMGSICGSEMRVDVQAPLKEEKQPATSPKWNTASGKKSRRNKKKTSSEKEAPASPAKSKTKKSRANRRGKRGGKRKAVTA